MDENRPDVPYFIGAHFYMKNDRKKAFENFKKAFEIGYSVIHQHSLKPTIYFYFAPKFLAELCYEEGEYELGEKACQVFLNNNPPTDESFKFMLDWYKIYQLLSRKLTNNYKVPEKKLLVFLADGGFNTWTGKDILTKGVGGSETHTIEMARYLKKHSDFEVIVFCNCEEDDEFEGVKYMHLTKIFKFFSENFIDTVFISRYSEYIPFAIQSGTDNIYVVLHDLGPTGSIIPVHPKLKKIFCLSEWHVGLVKKNFSALEDRIEHFYYGIDPVKWGGKIEKVANRFIYSSFPNRGLLPLLQIWPKICSKIKDAELHIYCDVNGKWVNDNFPDEMNLIRQMLAEAKQVVYHGWVNKEELAKGWLSADVWFYPCKFMETFCLTALEAAYTRTLAITNGLAALENTVGERGVTIEGDVMTEDWQDRALGAIVWALGNKKYKDKLLDTNYNWASEMTWEQRAKEMLHIYLNQNIYENKNIFNWTHNFPINMDSRGTFERILNRLSLKNINDLRVLEVGTHTGVSLIEIIKSVPNSIGYGVDKWDDKIGVEDSFYSNIRRAELKERIFGVKGETTNVLTVMTKSTQRFGLINVDGYENNLDIYGDLLFYWELLIRGGILSIDYTLKEGIKRFFEKYRGEYRILVISNRVFLEKL